MLKDDVIYAGHILDSARKARQMVAGKSRADYDADETLRLALTHLLQIIGEAARRLSAEFLTAHPQLPWSAIVGMRHKVVHDYMDVDEDVVWQTVINDLPDLIRYLDAIVPPDDDA